MKIRLAAHFLSILLVCSCVTAQRESEDNGKFFGILNQVSPGEEEKNIILKLGQPSSSTIEENSVTTYEVLGYKETDGESQESIIIDLKSNRAIAVMTWIIPSHTDNNFTPFKARYFPNLKFEKITGCTSYHGGFHAIERKQGVIIGLRWNEVSGLALANPEFITSFIENIKKLCPSRFKIEPMPENWNPLGD